MMVGGCGAAPRVGAIWGSLASNSLALLAGSFMPEAHAPQRLHLNSPQALYRLTEESREHLVGCSDEMCTTSWLPRSMDSQRPHSTH